jgi:uncharacterized membrane protein
MKDKYLKHLKTKLIEFEVVSEDIEDVLADYDQLYEDALARGMSDEEVTTFLGNPDEVVYELISTVRVKRKKQHKHKVIAVMPFISVALFMVLGFYFELWHPGWLVFLLIPVTAIIFETKKRERLMALTPFLAVALFMVLGFVFNLWHPGWLVFLLIPVTAIALEVGKKDRLLALSPFIALIVFFILGMFDLWNPGWLVFLMIPMLGILKKESSLTEKIIFEAAFIFAIAFYLYMGYVHQRFDIGALAFILPFGYGLLIGDIQIFRDWSKSGSKNKYLLMLTIVLFINLVFFASGFLFNAWAYMWQVYLLIPVAAIIIFERFKFVAIAPFIAVILFFSLGFFFNLFYISWIAFFLIPIAAILSSGD